MNVMTEVTGLSAEILNSWKEIARYLGRGVRTVQRWEAELNLPVRRPHGKGRTAVIAFRSELDLWLKRCPREARDRVAGGNSGLAAYTRNLIAESQQLREELRQSRLQLRTAVRSLRANLGQIRVDGLKRGEICTPLYRDQRIG
jgi:hypothetical protein